jgi:radical SAM superfamily enzyme YgiQ (UPF0313 family)
VKVLLLSTYELGHPPHHLASPLGFLTAAGIDARAIDLSVDKLDPDAVRAAQLVAIAVPMHTALRLGAHVARHVRELNPSCHLCFFGLYAPLNREWLLTQGASSVIGGEYEVALVELAKSLAPPPDVVLDRLHFVAPDRRGLRLERYAKLATPDGEKLAGYTEASRGCKHLCRHCPIPPIYGGRFFVVPPEIVIDDVRRQVAAGAQHVTFGDPDFLNGPKHALAILRALHAEFPSLTFDVTAKIEHLLQHREHLAELRALGVVFVVSAVESLSDRFLALLDKGHTRADADLAVTLCRAAGLTLRPSLVPFSPFTDLADYRELLDWIERRELIDHIDPIHLAIRLLVPPGSKLLELDEVRAALGPLEPDRLSHRWTHADARVDALQRAVLAAVENGARASEDPRATFARVKSLLARAERGESLAVEKPAKRPPSLPRAPRLTESWFC